MLSAMEYLFVERMDKKKQVPSVFDGIKLRKVWHDDEWYFSVVDIVQILTNSPNPRNYWNMLKKREEKQGIQLYIYCVQLKLKSNDGKYYLTDCSNFQNALRIIQSIPSKKAEPFKLWLASLGQAEVYRQQGYDEYWIEQRMKSKLARYEITGEWKNRGVEKPFDFAVLTNIIAKATFDKDISEHKKTKKLQDNQNLRDNMTDLELLFGTLGERLAKEVTVKRDSSGVEECQDSAHAGGRIAGRARKDAERVLKEPIVSSKTRREITRSGKRKRISKK